MITWESPIAAPAWAGEPVIHEQDGRPVVMRYAAEPEIPAPGLADLSHLPKALMQGEGVSRLGGLKLGQALYRDNIWLGRLAPDEAVAWIMPGGQTPDAADFYSTDMTEAWALLALFGPDSPAIMQRLVAVDVERPQADDPIYLAAPCHGVRVQVINPKAGTPGFLLACARSDAQFIYDSCLEAGRGLSLKPVGMEACQGWLAEQG